MMDKALNGNGGEGRGIRLKEINPSQRQDSALCSGFMWLISKTTKLLFHFREDGGGAGLTHLPELVVDQLQPGDVQIVQVVAAEVRRPGAARPLRPAVSLTPRLWQQSGGKTREFHHLVTRSRDLYCALASASSRLKHSNTSSFIVSSD